MDNKKWIEYWKKSLIDSLKSDIDITKHKHIEIENFDINEPIILDLKQLNEFIDFEENLLNKKKEISKNDIENWIKIDEVEILISPFKLIEEQQYNTNKKNKFPFWLFAKINRNGELNLPDEIIPFFQRKYLEPQADEKNEFIFSSIDKVNEHLNIKKEELDNYNIYIDYIKNTFKDVTNQEIEHYKCDNHKTLDNAVILIPDEKIGASIGIIELYEKILKEKQVPNLLKELINLNNETENEPLEVIDFIKANHLHLGQMGYEFPISISQRKSFYTFLNSKDKVFAINGPPGTGKTTLLQSIVANKFVESAIKGDKPPIILACSTNNQAVTNIIESFSKSNTKSGNLEGRWLPNINGYATYLPASSKKESELNGINYKKLSGEGLFNKIENQSFLMEAKTLYLEKSANYFNEPLSISEVISKIQNELKEIKNSLADSSVKWQNYIKSEDIFKSLKLENENKFYIDNLISNKELEKVIISIEKTENSIINHFNNESLFRKLFCFIGLKSSLRARKNEIKILIRNTIIEKEVTEYSKDSILELLSSKNDKIRRIITTISEWKNWKDKNSIAGNPPKNSDEYWKYEMLKIKNKVKPNCFYDELDVNLRHKAFQLSIHYWEGRYLNQLEVDLLDEKFERGKGKAIVEKRWQRQAMLTPCFVSTFYMAPKFFSYYKFLQKDTNGKPVFDNPALFNFVDLLLVDESGQVTPEVGTAIFSLAKQSVVVGDVKQIEPVWSISNKIDIGNLKKCTLIKDYNDTIFETVYDPKGFLASSGSIMKMAQNASNYKEKKLSEKGVILQEHRRCYDEIINYCNKLAYNGLLIPLKGKSGTDLLFPPMYCIDVDSNSIRNNSSRQNKKEAQVLVSWLLENKSKIEEKYGSIEDSVGIITPFTGQKFILKNLLKNNGVNINKLKIGTVHALQGAERSIILFSMVYGVGDSATMFFDRDNKPNMLNVAVSRAKDNFIVFANTKILDKNKKTPSGILANHLTFENRILPTN